MGKAAERLCRKATGSKMRFFLIMAASCSRRGFPYGTRLRLHCVFFYFLHKRSIHEKAHFRILYDNSVRISVLLHSLCRNTTVALPDRNAGLQGILLRL